MSLRGDKRTEFPQSVRKAAFVRCCRNGTMPGIPQCENCGIELRAGNIIYEHLQPDGLSGEPTLENCAVYCRKVCAHEKTVSDDNPRMAKADAVLKKNFGLQAKKKSFQSRGFARAKPQHSATRPIERRNVTVV